MWILGALLPLPFLLQNYAVFEIQLLVSLSTVTLMIAPFIVKGFDQTKYFKQGMKTVSAAWLAITAIPEFQWGFFISSAVFVYYCDGEVREVTKVWLLKIVAPAGILVLTSLFAASATLLNWSKAEAINIAGGILSCVSFVFLRQEIWGMNSSSYLLTYLGSQAAFLSSSAMAGNFVFCLSPLIAIAVVLIAKAIEWRGIFQLRDPILQALINNSIHRPVMVV